MVIRKVMDHVLGFYFIRATKFKKSLRWIWSEVSFMYSVGLGVYSIASSIHNSVGPSRVIIDR